MIESRAHVQDHKEQQERPAEAVEGAEQEATTACKAASEAFASLTARAETAVGRELPGLKAPGWRGGLAGRKLSGLELARPEPRYAATYPKGSLQAICLQ